MNNSTNFQGSTNLNNKNTITNANSINYSNLASGQSNYAQYYKFLSQSNNLILSQNPASSTGHRYLQSANANKRSNNSMISQYTTRDKSSNNYE
jgi:hypothetical protein